MNKDIKPAVIFLVATFLLAMGSFMLPKLRADKGPELRIIGTYGTNIVNVVGTNVSQQSLTVVRIGYYTNGQAVDVFTLAKPAK